MVFEPHNGREEEKMANKNIRKFHDDDDDDDGEPVPIDLVIEYLVKRAQEADMEKDALVVLVRKAWDAAE